MDGEDGGVAMASRLSPELEGGDVEGTVRLTTGESSPSPVREQSARGGRGPTGGEESRHPSVSAAACSLLGLRCPLSAPATTWPRE